MTWHYVLLRESTTCRKGKNNPNDTLLDASWVHHSPDSCNIIKQSVADTLHFDKSHEHKPQSQA